MLPPAQAKGMVENYLARDVVKNTPACVLRASEIELYLMGLTLQFVANHKYPSLIALQDALQKDSVERILRGLEITVDGNNEIENDARKKAKARLRTN